MTATPNRPALRLATQNPRKAPAAAVAAPEVRQAAWLRGYVQGGNLAPLTGAQAKTLLGLLAHVGAAGEAWPSVERLAVLAGLSEGAVKRARAGLVERGAIERTDDRRATATYRLSDAWRASGERRPATENGIQTALGGGSASATQGSASATPGVAPALPRTEDYEVLTTSAQHLSPADAGSPPPRFEVGGIEAAAQRLTDVEGFEPADALSLAMLRGPAQVDVAIANADHLAAARQLRSRRGYIAMAIRRGYPMHPGLVEAAARKARRAAARDAASAQGHPGPLPGAQERESTAAQWRAIRDAVAALEPAALARLAAEALTALPPLMRAVLRDKDPLESRPWLREIHRLLPPPPPPESQNPSQEAPACPPSTPETRP
jgi:hypothetical protein